MVGEGKEVIAICFVPLNDHFRVVVAVAPEGVRVEIAFPPARRWCGLAAEDAEEQ